MTVKLKMANPGRYSAPGSDPGRTSSPYLAYHSTRMLRATASPTPSSSQPTGWRGRRLATTAPTAAELTVASTTAAEAATRPATLPCASGSPAESASRVRRVPGTSASTASPATPHASATVHRRPAAGPPAPFIAIVLGPPNTLRCRHPCRGSPHQRGRPASRYRYEDEGGVARAAGCL